MLEKYNRQFTAAIWLAIIVTVLFAGACIETTPKKETITIDAEKAADLADLIINQWPITLDRWQEKYAWYEKQYEQGNISLGVYIAMKKDRDEFLLEKKKFLEYWIPVYESAQDGSEIKRLALRAMIALLAKITVALGGVVL